MNVKEAIEILKGYETPAALVVISELQASQKREREMFKAMADGCAWHDIRLMCHRNKEDGPATKCTKRNCPLLKGGSK